MSIAAPCVTSARRARSAMRRRGPKRRVCRLWGVPVADLSWTVSGDRGGRRAPVLSGLGEEVSIQGLAGSPNRAVCVCGVMFRLKEVGVTIPGGGSNACGGVAVTCLVRRSAARRVTPKKAAVDSAGALITPRSLPVLLPVSKFGLRGGGPAGLGGPHAGPVGTFRLGVAAHTGQAE